MRDKAHRQANHPGNAKVKRETKMARYVKTVTIHSVQGFDGMKPGQWFQWANGGSRGQFYGTTRAGVDVVRTQHGVWGKPSDCERARLQRMYAKQHGAK